GAEVFVVDADAHLEANIFLVIDIPGAGMTNHVAIGGLQEHRALPESLGQRLKTKRGEKTRAIAHHLEVIDLFLLQNWCEVDTFAVAGNVQEIVDVGPVLRPDVSEQVRGDRAVGWNQLRTVLLVELITHVGVKRQVEGTDLLPETFELGRKL